MLRRYVSVIEWLPGYRRDDLPGDLVAGLTGAAILVPQGMAYAEIAGLPPVVGLYASVLPLVAYALLGLEIGVALAVVVSILLIVVRVSMPRMPEMGRFGEPAFLLPLGSHPDARPYEKTVVLRVDAPLWFSNADALRARVREIGQQHPELETLVLDMSGVDELDSTADHELRKLAARCSARHIELLLLQVPEPVREVLDASGFTDVVGRDAYVDTMTQLDTRLTRP